MIAVQILEGHDKVQPTDWARPLVMFEGEDGLQVNSFNCYSGTPMNNVGWVQVQDMFGQHFFGMTVDELHKQFGYLGCEYEFVRGAVPSNHIFDWRKKKVNGS